MHKLIGGFEELVLGTALDDFAFPENRNEVGDPPRSSEVVADHEVTASALGVDFLDQLAEKGGADRIEAGTYLLAGAITGSSTAVVAVFEVTSVRAHMKSAVAPTINHVE